MTKELKARGRVIGQNKVAAMMRAADLHAKRKRKFKATTDSKHNYPVAPNLLNQDFSVSRTDLLLHKWQESKSQELSN